MNNKVKNILWYSADKYIVVLMSFITTVILSRIVEPSLLGEIVLLQSLVILFNIVTLSAMDSVFIKKLTESGNYFKSVLLLKLVCAFSSFSLYFLYIFLFDSAIDLFSRAVIGIPLLLSFSTFVDVTLMQRKEIYKIAPKTLIIYIVFGFAKCGLLFGVDDLLSICILLVIDQIISRLFVILYGFKNGILVLKSNKITREVLRDSFSLLNEGKYLVLSSFFLVGFVRTNQILVDLYLGSDELAFFSMPIKIVDGLTIIITTYVASVYPYLLSSIKNVGVEETALRYFSGITKVAIIIASLTFYFSDNVIYHIFGSAYSSSTPVLQIYSLAIIFNYIFIASGRWFIAMSEVNFVAIRNVVAFFLNLTFSAILIPKYGIQGAAYSSLIAWAFSGYLSCVLSKNSRWLLVAIPKSFFKLVKPL
ncbi:oligosaccharide flippase family protein [Vibrio vulnificus]|nr:oligosaccharide flippase family protein [Vibrio vulnificus]EMA2414143.1 oligosaccharide flippase family protein [Vibrio vulnificus]MCU8102709.1 oligosaccharide flippase family protein [Vibrio vulnificus]HAS8312847.1 hypothetical protein [Vibrio vulnificus]